MVEKGYGRAGTFNCKAFQDDLNDRFGFKMTTIFDWEGAVMPPMVILHDKYHNFMQIFLWWTFFFGSFIHLFGLSNIGTIFIDKEIDSLIKILNSPNPHDENKLYNGNLNFSSS